MELQDVVSSLVAFLIGVGLLLVVERGFSRMERVVAWLAFTSHALAALAMVWITVEILGGGDIRAYHMFGAPLADAMRADFLNVAPDVVQAVFHIQVPLPVPIHGVGSATGAMSALSSFIFLVFGNSLYGACMVVSIGCLFARILIYRVMCDNITQGERLPVAIACLLVPSVTFWCSGLLKESFAFGGIAVLFWGVNGIMKRRPPLRPILAILVGATLAAIVKPYILMPAGVGIGAWLYVTLTHQGSPLRSLWALPLAGTLGLFAIVAVGALFPRFAFSNLAEESLAIQTMYQYRTTATSTITLFDPAAIAPEERGFASQLVYAPIAVLTALFRPALFDVKNTQMLVNALEASIFLLLFVVAILRNGVKRLLQSLFERPTLAFCALFVLGMSVGVGLVVSNLGSLSRYRTPMMPFFAIGLALTYRRLERQNVEERARTSQLRLRGSLAEQSTRLARISAR